MVSDSYKSKTNASHGSSKKKTSGGFQSLGLSPPFFKAVMALGYKVPTPIQRKALPVVLSGKDVVAMARTGSGKTAAFLIPMLEKLKEHSTKVGVRAVVMSPTRELAIQTLKFTKSLAKFTDLKAALIVGGDSMEQQFGSLASNPDILVATPGRLMHHLQEIPDFSLRSVEYCVFDEADRIFEMGFAEQLQEIMRTMPTSRQTVLFSATLPKALVQFARAGLSDPELIRLDVENMISENLKMSFFAVRSEDKPAAFLYILRNVIPKNDQTIVFAATRHHVEFLHELLKASGMDSVYVYGDMDQSARKINVGKFRARKTNLLIVTDVAARGIDIPLLNNVFNYHFSSTPKLFVHRVGRAARAGRNGTAFNFVDPEELPYLVDLQLYLGHKIESMDPNVKLIKSGADTSVVQRTAYTLDSMRSDEVHYGSIPQENIDSEVEHVNEIMKNHPHVSPLVKVCANAYKQFSRTRTDPSKQSIARSKILLSMTHFHPLFRVSCTSDEIVQNDVRSQLHGFRPKQTIFEVSTGAHSLKKNSAGVVMMRKKRSEHQRVIVTNEKKKSSNNNCDDQDSTDSVNKTVDETVDKTVNDNETAAMSTTLEERRIKMGLKSKEGLLGPAVPRTTSTSATAQPVKRKLSKAERKKLKKSGGDRSVLLESTKNDIDGDGSAPAKTKADMKEFKDEENYIGYLSTSDQIAEQVLSRGGESGKSNSFMNNQLEEAILDVNPDEAMQLNDKKRIMHWDSRKKKYIKATVKDIRSGAVNKRNESGAKVQVKAKVGEIYKKWQKRGHDRVGMVGEEEETGKVDYRSGRKRMKLNNSATPGRPVKDELLSESVIRKEEARKARSRGVSKKPKKKGNRGKGNVVGKSHGAPTRSKAIIRR